MSFAKEPVEEKRGKELSSSPLLDTTSLQINLDLPKPKLLEKNEKELYLYNTQEYKRILIIYNNYISLGHQLLKQMALNIITEQNVLIEKEKYNICEYAFAEVQEDREFIYKVREQEEKEYKVAKSKDKIKTILFTTGGVAVGAAIGIIIGVFAIPSL